jgi:hypothetical protein
MCGPFNTGEPIMPRSHVARTLATLLVLLLAPTLVLAAHHEGEEAKDEGRKPWDQAAMTGLSAELATSAAQIRRTFRQDPSFRNPKTPNQNAVHQMEQTLRNLEITTRRLSRQVKAGRTAESTEGLARRIGMLLNDADMWGRRIMTSAYMEEQVRPAMKLINQIAPYYGSGPLYDPETMQRLDRAPNPQRPEAAK